MTESFVPRSTHIAAVEYDGESRTLTVEFMDGDRYEYTPVSQDIYDAFRAAPSAGQFFHRQIEGRFIGTPA